MTINVRGLNDPLVASRLGNYIKGMRPQIDISCLQEHKLQDTHLETNLFRVWPVVVYGQGKHPLAIPQ